MTDEFSDAFQQDSVVQNDVEAREGTKGDYATFANPKHHDYECLHGSNVVSSLVILTQEAATNTL